jgi:AraC-like DNA-binding protein
MKPAMHSLLGTFLAACSINKVLAYEQFFSEHILGYQIAGETQLYHQKGYTILKEGQMVLARRDQFAKNIKIQEAGKEYRIVAVILSAERLRKFALDNNMASNKKYGGPKNILIKPDSFLKGYFLSLLPYIDEERTMSKKMASIKANEAIELLLELKPELEGFLFDFADPDRVDLEEFMMKNFQYNAPIENFAKLSGRSLSSFKREFAETFRTTPAKWLKNRRLSEAFYLIQQKNRKPQDIYIELGFENLSHFYVSFKQKYGQTPAEIKLKDDHRKLP